MPSVVRPSRSSPEAYRALERKADDTSEDVNGPIIAMAGASRPPHRLAGPLSRAVRQPWRGRPGAASRRDRRVTVSRTGLSTSPDGVVVCGESTAKAPATRLPPLGMVAVLSAATAAADRGATCAHDRRLASLHAARLVAQDNVRLEHDVRQEGAQGVLAEVNALPGTVPLASMGCDVGLQEVYDQVPFVPSDEATPAEQGLAGDHQEPCIFKG